MSELKDESANVEDSSHALEQLASGDALTPWLIHLIQQSSKSVIGLEKVIGDLMGVVAQLEQRVTDLEKDHGLH